MRPTRLDIDPANVDADGLADNNASSGATLALDGALTSGGTFTSADGLAHRLSITDTSTQAQDDSVFTVTGTDANGRTQTEAVTGPGSTLTVTSTKYFLTVSTVTIVGGDASDTVDMGTVDEVAAKTIIVPHRNTTPHTLQVEVTGTINYSVEVTAQDPFTVGDSSPFDLDDQEDLAWIDDGNFSGKTASMLDDLAASGVRALRVVANSYTDTAELQVRIVPVVR